MISEQDIHGLREIAVRGGLPPSTCEWLNGLAQRLEGLKPGPTVAALKLPIPVSANAYWESYVPRGWSRAVVHLSTEAKRYKRDVGWLCKAAGIHQPVRAPVAVDIRLFPRPSGRGMDVDNACKVLLDSMKEIVYLDDWQVCKLTVERMPKDGDPRVEVGITEHAVHGPLL